MPSRPSNSSAGRTQPARKSAKNAVTGGGTSVVDLESQRAATVHNNHFAAGTNKTYSDNVRRMVEWCEFQLLKGTLPDDLPSQSVRQAFRAAPDEHSPRVLVAFLTGLHIQGYVPNTLYSYVGAARKFWQEIDPDVYKGDRFYFCDRTGRWEGDPTQTALVQQFMQSCVHEFKSSGASDLRKHSAAMKYEWMQDMFSWSEHEVPTPADYARAPSVWTDPALYLTTTKHLLIRAFLSVGFTLWLRNFETLKLKRKDITLVSGHNGEPDYIRIKITDRKGWTRRNGGGDWDNEDLAPNTYHLYDRPDMPAANVWKHLQIWLLWLESRYYGGREMGAEDYVFPSFSPNGVIQRDTAMSHDHFQGLLDAFVDASGVGMKLCGKRLTTHCLRRGGAQYFFTFAPAGARWTLARVRWWGGWAPGEDKNTLLKYLLDELSTYEDSHADALRPAVQALLEPPDAEPAWDDMHATGDKFGAFADSQLRVLTRAFTDLRVDLTRQLFAQTNQIGQMLVAGFDAMQAPLQAVSHTQYMFSPLPAPGIAPTSTPDHRAQVYCPPSGFPPSIPGDERQNPSYQVRMRLEPPPVAPISPLAWSPAAGQPFVEVDAPMGPQRSLVPFSAGARLPSGDMAVRSQRPRHHIQAPVRPPLVTRMSAHSVAAPTDLAILNVPYTGTAKRDSWRNIVEQYDVGRPQHGMPALKDWPKDWLRGEKRKKYAVLYRQRLRIAEEFIIVFARDEARFLAAYPEHINGHSTLLEAITAKMKLDGRVQSRSSKNGTPEARTRRNAG
ncbi:unnamed protein product [Peniophora sp. CBMAI 1063]|nr:unnamed protein product [Peniophora sp. CBMAI 1063]